MYRCQFTWKKVSWDMPSVPKILLHLIFQRSFRLGQVITENWLPLSSSGIMKWYSSRLETTPSTWSQPQKERQMSFNYVNWLGWQGIYMAQQDELHPGRPTLWDSKKLLQMSLEYSAKELVNFMTFFPFTFFLYKIFHSLYWRATDPHTYILV